MKVAVNYENGQIFQHFGQTKTFKLYTIENNAVTAAELVPGIWQYRACSYPVLEKPCLPSPTEGDLR